jgi:hypothetical protein
MKFILLLIGIYLLYRFIFGFVIPVASATKQMSRKMQEFQQQQQNNYQQQQSTYNPAANKNPKPGADDYIEFEDVK